MRDMPRTQTRYPMNLAETASIFFETVVGDRLVEMAATPEEKLEYAWYDAESAAAFLLNIPTRFDFECRMHEARDRGETLTPTLLREMMAEAWQVFLPCTSCRLRTREQWPLIDFDCPCFLRLRAATETPWSRSTICSGHPSYTST